MKKGKRIFKSVFKIIFRIFRKVLVLVALTFLVSVLLTNFVLHNNLVTTLEYAGVILMAIGGFSVMGGRKTAMGRNYMWNRSTAGIEDASMKEMELFMQSYEFCFFMALSGLIVLLIGMGIYYL